MKKILFIFGIVLLTSFTSTNDNKSFEVKIEMVKSKVQLTPSSGFNFSLMAFTKKTVYLNESGMIDFKNKEEVESSDFIFKLNRKNKTIILEGIKNTKWKFITINESALINESGIK